jgi:hypothetical protein
MACEPTVDRFDVLARTESAAREIGACAQGRLAVGVGGPHDEVRGTVEGIADLNEGVRFASEQP